MPGPTDILDPTPIAPESLDAGHRFAIGTTTGWKIVTADTLLRALGLICSGNLALPGGTTVLGTLEVQGAATATSFTGSGEGLTALPAGSLTGSVADARLSANVPLKNAANTFSTNQTVTGTLAATTLTGAGSGITALNGSNVSSGTVADARLSSNVALKNANNNFSVGQTVTGTVQATTLTATGNVLGAAILADNGLVRQTLDVGGDQTNGILNLKDEAGTATISIFGETGYVVGAGFEGDGSALNNLQWGNIVGAPSIPEIPSNISAFTNDSGYLTAVNYGQVTDMTGGMVQVSGGTIVNDIDVYSDGAGSLTVTNNLTAGSANIGSSIILLNSDGSAGFGGEVVMSSVLKLTGLPTSDPSNPGQVWLDTMNGNVLKVSV